MPRMLYAWPDNEIVSPYDYDDEHEATITLVAQIGEWIVRMSRSQVGPTMHSDLSRLPEPIENAYRVRQHVIEDAARHINSEEPPTYDYETYFWALRDLMDALRESAPPYMYLEEDEYTGAIGYQPDDDQIEASLYDGDLARINPDNTITVRASQRGEDVLLPHYAVEITERGETRLYELTIDRLLLN